MAVLPSTQESSKTDVITACKAWLLITLYREIRLTVLPMEVCLQVKVNLV